MKWSFETFDAKKSRLTQWTAWFAWRPIRYKTEDGKHNWLWLERIYRRAVGYQHDCWVWEYALDDFDMLKSKPIVLEDSHTFFFPKLSRIPPPPPGSCRPPPPPAPPPRAP